MKISYLNAYEALRKQAFLLPDLVDQLERKDFNTINNLLEWLRNTEKKLKEFQFSECAEMAALRSKLLQPPSANQKRQTKRKMQWKEAPTIVMMSQGILMKALDPLQDRIEEARDAVNQLLGIAHQNQLIQMGDNKDFNGLIQSLWNKFSISEQYRGGIAKVMTLINRTDGIRLMAAEIEFSN